MPLIKEGKVVADTWTAINDDEALAEEGSVLVSLARWRRDRDLLIARAAPVGVRLESSQLAPEIGEDASRLQLIALEFPSFRDGRPYSTARLLRERYGFRGELRAVGNVLRDQLLFMQRCGFDAFEIADPQAADLWAKAIGEMSLWYQPATDARVTVSRMRRLRRAAE